MKITIELLNQKPDIHIHGLKIWVHDWQFPDGVEGDDENWLHVTVLCEAKNAVVWREGNFIESDRIRWMVNNTKNFLLDFQNNGFGEDAIYLQSDEPYFGLHFEYIHLEPNEEYESGVGPSLTMIAELTPDHHEQSHRFSWETSFEQLEEFVKQCELVLSKYSPR